MAADVCNRKDTGLPGLTICRERKKGSFQGGISIKLLSFCYYLVCSTVPGYLSFNVC